MMNPASRSPDCRLLLVGALSLALGACTTLTAPQLEQAVVKANQATLDAAMTAAAQAQAAAAAASATNDALERESARAVDASAAAIAPLPEGSGGVMADTATVQLSNLIEAYAERPWTVNPLRLRLAYLLLQQQRPHGAQVIFDEIDGSRLGSELQRVLFEHWAAWKWWWRVKGSAALSLPDIALGERYAAALVASADEPGRTNYVRALLQQYAMNIRLQLVQNANSRADARKLLLAALADYERQFSPLEQTLVANLAEGGAADVAPTMLRWYLRVPWTFACAQLRWEAFELTPPFAERHAEVPAWTQHLYGARTPAELCN